MDFRTEWSSWFLLILMIIMAIIINPYHHTDTWDFQGTLLYLVQTLAYPFFAVTVASIPVVIICWIVKVIPDIDYSIRVGFLLMLILFVGQFVS